MQACSPTRTRGFTLIELLVVVLIIGLLTTGATLMLSGGGPRKDLHDSIEQFVGVAHQVSDLSILTGEPMGLVLTPPLWSEQAVDQRSWQYRWRRFVEMPDGNGNYRFDWLEVEGLEPIALNKEIELFVHLEGSEWDWEANPPSDEPVFVLYPSGEAEPLMFEIEFAHKEASLEPQHVLLDRSGHLEWKEALDDQQAREARFE